MKSIIIVMLCVQAAIFLVTIFIVAFQKYPPAKARRIFFSTGTSLFVVAMVSWQIAGRHAQAAGADVLQFGAPMLLGMAILCFLIQVRRVRGLDGIEVPSSSVA